MNSCREEMEQKREGCGRDFAGTDCSTEGRGMARFVMEHNPDCACTECTITEPAVEEDCVPGKVGTLSPQSGMIRFAGVLTGC